MGDTRVFLTENRASLEEFSDLFEAIERPATFFCVGKIPTRIEARLVPVGSMRNLDELLQHQADVAAVICPAEVASRLPGGIGCAISPQPLEAAHEIHQRLTQRADYYWKRFPTRIHPDAEVRPGARVAEYDVVIGAGTVIDSNALVLERSVIGDNCYIGPGTVVSCLAYELVKVRGRPRLMAQAGGVRLGDNVTVLTNTTIARSVFPVFTEIGDDCAFDNLVHVGHDVVLASGVRMAASSMVCGRVTVGEDTFLGPKAMVTNGVNLGRGVQVSLGSMVSRDVPDNTKVTGYFAVEHSEFLAAFKRLHDS